MEEWKKVKGTHGKYLVSDMGKVMSLAREEAHIMTPTITEKGYLRVYLTIHGKSKGFSIHRLVAEAFLDNPDSLPQVNHIDCNKKNNGVDNLEWISNIDNAHHAIENGLWKSVYAGALAENEKRKKAIIAYKDNEELRFRSISEAERYFGSRHITDVLKGKRQRVKGWTFSYDERG